MCELLFLFPGAYFVRNFLQESVDDLSRHLDLKTIHRVSRDPKQGNILVISSREKSLEHTHLNRDTQQWIPYLQAFCESP